MSFRVPQKALVWSLLAFCACGREERPGQIMVSLYSQMPIPKDIDKVSVEVRYKGTREEFKSFTVRPAGDPAGINLPATLNVVEGTPPTERFQLRVGAWDRTGRLRIARAVTTTVPKGRVASLPVEMQWYCYDRVNANSPTLPVVENQDDKTISSDCGENETCIDGECRPDEVDSSTLDDFREEDVFGTNPNDACLNVTECFAGASEVFVVNRQSCQIDRPSGGVGINVALALPAGGEGYCTADRCLIPLTGLSERGWVETAGRLQLPAASCELLDQGKVTGILVTTTCKTKTQSVRVCP